MHRMNFVSSRRSRVPPPSMSKALKMQSSLSSYSVFFEKIADVMNTSYMFIVPFSTKASKSGQQLFKAGLKIASNSVHVISSLG